MLAVHKWSRERRDDMVTIRLKYKRDTKRWVVYALPDEPMPGEWMIDTLYIHKSAFAGLPQPPATIEVQVSWQ
jgi:hypothetical protein